MYNPVNRHQHLERGPVSAPKDVVASLAPAVTRAVKVLEFLARSAPQPQTLTSIARAIGAAKSSTSNICSVLLETEMIRRRGDGYLLGRLTAELGGAYLAAFNEVDEFYQICDESPVLAKELAQLAVLDGTNVQYLARREGDSSLRLTARVGQRLPAALTAVGNVMLAALEPSELDGLLEDFTMPAPMTDRSHRTIADLRGAIDRARERGYAIDDGGVFPHVVGVAVAVPVSSGVPLAIGVSMIGRADEIPAARIEALVEALTGGAAKLARAD